MIQFYRDVLGFDIKEQEEQVMFIQKKMVHYFFCIREILLKK